MLKSFSCTTWASAPCLALQRARALDPHADQRYRDLLCSSPWTHCCTRSCWHCLSSSCAQHSLIAFWESFTHLKNGLVRYNLPAKLSLNALLHEETGLVFLLLFTFRGQGCFSSGQIQSSLGQPSSWFSAMVWTCSTWCLSRKGWFSERGHSCVGVKGKGRRFCLRRLFLEPFRALCSAAWHVLCLSYAFVIRSWERVKSRSPGLENRCQDKQDADRAPLLIGRGKNSLTDVRGKPHWIQIITISSASFRKQTQRWDLRTEKLKLKNCHQAVDKALEITCTASSQGGLLSSPALPLEHKAATKPASKKQKARTNVLGCFVQCGEYWP